MFGLMTTDTLRPKKKKPVDIEFIFKVITVTVSIFTVYSGIQQYNKGIEREFRKNYYERQLTVYHELIELCSKISITPSDSIDSETFRELELKLNENYHGKLSLFENIAVENAVSDFLLYLDNFKRDDPAVTNNVMKNKCFQITQACRCSLNETYDVELKELELSIQDSSNQKISESGRLALNN